MLMVAGPGLQGDRWQPDHNPTETETCAMFPTGKFGEAIPAGPAVGPLVVQYSRRAGSQGVAYLPADHVSSCTDSSQPGQGFVVIDVPAPWRQCTWTWIGYMVIRHVLGPIPRGRLTCSPDLLSSEVLAFPHSYPLIFSIVTNNFTPSFLFEPHPML